MPEPQFGPVGARGLDASGRSPIPNMDLATFRNWLMRALSGDQDVPPAILTRVNEALREHGSDATKRDREWWQNYFWQRVFEDQLRAIDRYIDGLNRMADELRQRIDENKAKVYENDRWIEDMERRHKGAAPALDYYKENGVFERDEDGKLKNKDAQMLLDEYARRTGQKPESDTAIAFAIKDQERVEREEAERRKIENRKLGEEIKTDEGRLKEVEEKVRRAIERRNEIAEDNKNDPALAQQKIKKFWQEEGKTDIEVLKAARISTASDSTIQREADDAKNDIARSHESDDDLDLSTFKKPNDLAKNFNAKVTETPPAIQVAENAAPDSLKRDAVPPGPQVS